TEQSGNLNQKARKLTPIVFWIYKKIYQTSNFIHVISHFLKQIILALGVDEKKIEVIPNGINLSELRQVIEKRREKEKYRIICVARLEKYKGIEYLIEALPKILESFPKARLVLVGEGQERKNLESQVKNLRLEKKVEFKGEIPHERIPEELTKSSVFVLPSLEEGQGLVVLEAQAAQIPVIATKVGGIPDFVKDGETGILIKPADSRALSQGVIKVFSTPEFAQKLIENAKDNLEKYDWDNVAEKIDQIYQKFIK
ncbi:MAG: glycosyltransferase family 4 protein, partial [Candidatus Aminicenantia bacterium]